MAGVKVATRSKKRIDESQLLEVIIVNIIIEESYRGYLDIIHSQIRI